MRPIPVSALRSVVLPAPDGPMSAVSCAAPNLADTFVSACFSFLPSPTVIQRFFAVISMRGRRAVSSPPPPPPRDTIATSLSMVTDDYSLMTDYKYPPLVTHAVMISR